ncbi:MAG: Rpn family recombination-promoting nuclease/putative transposase [Fibromonadales bacterium]|nr:Rpn family recombination-promoting nuclease/putative transposase [Fibromonadales bacterium]
MISENMRKELKELQKIEGKGKFANLTLDMPFKKAFGSETEKEPLIATLNACLERKLKYPIADVDIKNPYIIGQTKGSRDTELDIRCRDSQGNEFIVEMQIGRQKHFVKRANYYASMVIAASAPKGDDWDFDYPSIYSLNFLNFDLDIWGKSDNIIHHVSFFDEDMPELRFDSVNLVFVRLSRFEKSLEECESFRDKLFFSLRHAHEFDEKPAQLEGDLFDKIFMAAKIASFTSREYEEYRAGLMRKWDYGASMKFAKEEGVAEGWKSGKAEGITIGEAKGVAIGEAKGVLRTARQMKAEGLSFNLISRVTGLSEDEIERL